MTPFDPPEKIKILQQLDFSADIWSLGVVIFHIVIALQEGTEHLDTLLKLSLRDLTYDTRLALVQAEVKDVAMRDLLSVMLRDAGDRPRAAELLQDPCV